MAKIRSECGMFSEKCQCLALFKHTEPIKSKLDRTYSYRVVLTDVTYHAIGAEIQANSLWKSFVPILPKSSGIAVDFWLMDQPGSTWLFHRCFLKIHLETARQDPCWKISAISLPLPEELTAWKAYGIQVWMQGRFENHDISYPPALWPSMHNQETQDKCCQVWQGPVVDSWETWHTQCPLVWSIVSNIYHAWERLKLFVDSFIILQPIPFPRTCRELPGAQWVNEHAVTCQVSKVYKACLQRFQWVSKCSTSINFMDNLISKLTIVLLLTRQSDKRQQMLFNMELDSVHQFWLGKTASNLLTDFYFSRCCTYNHFWVLPLSGWGWMVATSSNG